MNEHDVKRRQTPVTSVSRRELLRGAGALAAGMPLAGAVAQTALSGDPDGIRRVGPRPVTTKLKINGEPRAVQIEPRHTLLEVLRDQLDLTGTKEVCARGACGGCTVHVNGAPVNSCMMLALDAVGADVTTIEGLAQQDKLTPLQEAFRKHDAMQCGYCTPGLVMSLDALLARNKRPSLDDIRGACSGNICRCGTYPKVFEAALAAAGLSAPSGNIADNAGRALENDGSRVDAALKVTGKARYTTDVNLPRMAHAAIVSCPYGRAKLRSFDEDAAKKVPGVLDVSIRPRDEYAYCGQPTGHVCAETRQALGDAIAALRLEWTPLECTTDPRAAHQSQVGALPPDLKDVPAGRGQEGSDDRRKRAGEILAGASKTLERTFTTQIQTHSCLEPHCAVADYRVEQAELWCSTQGTMSTHAAAARAFELDQSKVRVHCEHVGGGFGSKLVGLGLEGLTAAQLSKKLGRPVKVVNDRKREHLDVGCRPGSIQHMKVATDDHGAPVGGYVHVAGITGPDKGGGGAANPSRYNFGAVFKSHVDVALTVGGARPFRAPGHPQGMFAVDGFVDELADAAGVDPLEYRKRIETSDVRKRMFDMGAKMIGWSSRPRPNGSAAGRVKRGIGMAVGDWPAFKADAQIRVDVFKDGTVRVLSGTQDIGTGTRTVLVDTLADQLGIDRALITSDCGNSDYPPGPASGGSMTVHSIVPAIREAGDQAAAKLRELATEEIGDSDAWKRACRKIPGESFTVVGSKNPKYWGQGNSEGVQFVEVEVDTETGIVRPRRVVAVQNCGQAVNRLTAESQINGGVIQGLSYALFEEKILDPQLGCMVNPNLEQYKILGSLDCPEIRPVIWREDGEDGSRSLGEPPTIPTAAATANAVANAIGARVYDLPITPAKVLAALGQKGGVS